MSSIAVKSNRKNQSSSKMVEIVCYGVMAVALVVFGMCIVHYFQDKSTAGLKQSENHAASSKVASAEKAQPKKPISDDTLVKVSEYLKGKFRVGDWRYSGVEQHSSVVRAYIQIPEKLDFSKSQLKSYVRGSVCPVKSNPIWQTISRKQLEVHLYVSVKNASDVTRCG